jgi:hypothetical protein
MKKIISLVFGIVILLIALAAAAFADNPIKLIVNGYEIKPDISPQLINGRVMVPIRWAAEALGVDVQWDETANAVRINSSQYPSHKPLSKEQIETIIQAQGEYKDSYYVEGLSYEFTNIDNDADWEILAKIDGTVHLGNFFIFDMDSSGDYKLIAEQDWKVENWYFGDPIEIDGKKLFKLVTRTGGTGVDVFTVHLWYLDQGQFKEAWQGTLRERSMLAGPETFYMKLGGYQVDTEAKRLYTWETFHRLEQDGVTPKGDVKTGTAIYKFNGTVFILD